MSPQGFLLAGVLLMAASSLDMTQNHPARRTCPNGCTCYRATYPSFNGRLLTVNCSFLDITEFPEGLSLDTEVLLATNNRFRNLSDIPMLPALKILDLSNNRIRSLDNRRIYDNIGTLKTLILKNNAIMTLSHGTFSGLMNLDVLDLSHNALQIIEIHAFGGLNHLQKLLLDHNNILDVDRLWLQSMPFLTEINLKQNSLSRLDPRVFDSMRNLVHLDLSDNNIMSINETSFTNVNKLKVLDLSHNKLTQVPRCVLGISNLQILLLDANLFQRIQTNDFSNSNITEISMSFQPQLRVIEKGAFTNLPRLVNLQIHDNPHLIFIHQDTFQNVSRLSQLFLHNNKLMALSANIKESLPSLTGLHLYHNPLHCDCNVYWIKKELQDALNTTPADEMYIKEADKLLCDTPTGRTNMPLKQVSIDHLPPVCAPTALPLFSEALNITIGEDLYLECQAIGVPQPKIHWLLPDGQVLNASSTNERVKLLEDTAISVLGVRSSDTGTYACEAQNLVSYDISSVAVSVQKKDLKLFPISISNDYITVEWRGSIPRRHLSDFQLNYHEVNTDKLEVIYLSSSMPKCTISGLRPLTTYEVCIMYQHQYTIHCRNITTTHELTIKSGITRIKTSKIIAGVCTVVALTILLCFTTFMVKKFKKRKEYEEPETGEKGDVLSQIPLENLYQPPSTPLCTSRTALLPHSQI